VSKLSFARDAKAAMKAADTLLFLAPKNTYASGWLSRVAKGPWVTLAEAAAKDAAPGAGGATETVLTGLAKPKKVVIGVLPDSVSRHNSPARHEAIASCAARAGLTAPAKSAVILGLDDPEHFVAAANAVGRALPIFTRKGGKTETAGDVALAATDQEGRGIAADGWTTAITASARWTAWMVDTHPAELTTAEFAARARRHVRGLEHVTVREIVGPKLLDAGLRGIHAVGRAAMVAPRLLLLDYRPPRASRTFGVIGKGVVYDTGGLAIKPAASMCTMKGDMGGGAAAVGAFKTLVENGFKDRVICAVPLVENAIGPHAYRNDDILMLHSKKTVEVNNTDAEGRIILSDALSYVCRTYDPAAVMNAATLTGAQLITSGLRHASIVSNREGYEQLAVRTGRATGDLCHAILFAPEFFQGEFDSRFADMTNSVKDRSNAQSSCAAQFCYSHIEDLGVPWLHIDIAGPAWRDGRGSGFGVALMSMVVRGISAADLKA
jgi:probable aminopeptidase NPEPL1